MNKYIIVTQSAFGQVFLRKAESYSNRFTVEKDQATKFDNQFDASDWLVSQESTMNKQIWSRAKIIEDFK